MGLSIIPVTALEQNCSLYWCEETKLAVVIDPGGDVSRIIDMINQCAVKVQFILLTHGHLDHVGGAAELASLLNVDILGPGIDDEFWLKGVSEQARMFGFSTVHQPPVAQYLKAGDVIEFGQCKLEVLHCPGHTPGHVVFFDREKEHAWVGDVLFAGSIGRTDFPKGDYQTLIRSIREVLFPLGDQVSFTSGHGMGSTFGKERVSNPFL